MTNRRTPAAAVSCILLALALGACSSAQAPQTAGTLRPFDDARVVHAGDKAVYEEGEYRAEDLYTYWFNESNVFVGSEELQEQILEAGKNPGLGVRALHGRGITGEGVAVGIIDQPLLPDHPEFRGKLAAYYEVGELVDPGSMHGPAVASLLAGESVGTAPGARLYYAAMPSWEGDARQAAQALDWMREVSGELPEGEKIRVVSVSADFTREDWSYNDVWQEAVERAWQAGMVVLDARRDYDTCLIWPSYVDRADPERVEKSTVGSPDGVSFLDLPEQAVCAPIGYRTVAEEYEEGACSYAYDAQGGHSWAIPYGAGVLALGWQVNPALSGEEMTRLLRDTAYVNERGERFLYPQAFIAAVEGTLEG